MDRHIPHDAQGCHHHRTDLGQGPHRAISKTFGFEKGCLLFLFVEQPSGFATFMFPLPLLQIFDFRSQLSDGLEAFICWNRSLL